MKVSFPREKIKVLLVEGIHGAAVERFKEAGYTQVELRKPALSEHELLEILVRLVFGVR